MSYRHVSRRTVLKTAALGSAAVITAPYVSGVYAAGTITMGCWDHWVPGANKTLDKLCKEWGGKNKVDVHIDYITSQGEKDKLTAAAEAQAGTGQASCRTATGIFRSTSACSNPSMTVLPR